MRILFKKVLRTIGSCAQFGYFDGCVDFDMAVRDPEDPSGFREGYDSGDHLHPSMSCYVKMANTVSKEILV